MGKKCESCDYLWECIEGHKVDEINDVDGKTEYVKDPDANCYADMRRKMERIMEGGGFYR